MRFSPTLQSCLDALETPLAILDASGIIIATNHVWRHAPQSNGVQRPAYGPGRNYVTACAAARGHGADVAHAMAQGIQAVLHGQRQVFALGHACTSSRQEQWFQVRVRPVPGNEAGWVIVIHEPRTALKQAQDALQQTQAELAQVQTLLSADTVSCPEDVSTPTGFEDMIGCSAAMQRLLQQAAQVAPTETTVLILGETGTGKALLARALHRRSRRQERPLITVNCAALPSTLIESELFGHEKGAFTGAHSRQVGRFELADGGTLFLDEIGELPLELQAKLLRVLQEGEFERLGSGRTREADVRVLAATNCDLAQAVAAGRFRADLYYRLNVFPLQVPPLRQRQADIPLLVRDYITRQQDRLGKRITRVPQQVLETLTTYAWPGNVRELHNRLERALILSPGPTLIVDDLEPVLSTPVSSVGQTLAEVEAAHIRAVLEACGWRIKGVGQAAERLGLKPSTLRSCMKKLGIMRPAT